MTSSAGHWVRSWLLAAGVFHLALGLAGVLMPAAWFQVLGMELPRYPELWQWLGLAAMVLGLGFVIAANDPARHWPIALLALIAKVLAPIGFVIAASEGRLPWSFGMVMVVGDLLWIPVLVAVLDRACRQSAETDLDERGALSVARTDSGESILEISRERSVLVVGIRHSGCTFCRDSLAELARERERLGEAGILPVILHQLPQAEGEAFLAQFGLPAIDHVSDRNGRIRAALGGRRGGLWELIGWPAIHRALFQGRFWRFGAALPQLGEDPRWLPGAWLVRNGAVIHSWEARSAAECPPTADACEVALRQAA